MCFLPWVFLLLFCYLRFFILSVSSQRFWEKWVKAKEGGTVNQGGLEASCGPVEGSQYTSWPQPSTLNLVNPSMKLTFLMSKMRTEPFVLWGSIKQQHSQCWADGRRNPEDQLMTTGYCCVSRHDFWLSELDPRGPCHSFCTEQTGCEKRKLASISPLIPTAAVFLGKLVTVCSKQPEKHFWQQNRQVSGWLIITEDGFRQIKTMIVWGR